MQEYTKFFGLEFHKLRLRKNLSQWSVAVKIPYHIRNIQRIEQGITQPGVTLAFKLLRALEMHPGDFLQNLAERYSTELPQSLSVVNDHLIDFDRPFLADTQKSLFGTLLYRIRTQAKVSQTAMAKACNYNLRNINIVEKSMQEPGIMTALGLVLTTGVNVKDFFNRLYSWQMERPSESIH